MGRRASRTELRLCQAQGEVLSVRTQTPSAPETLLVLLAQLHLHFVDRKSALWTLSKFTLLVSGVPTQTEPPESLRVTTSHVALTAEEGRAGAEPRA